MSQLGEPNPTGLWWWRTFLLVDAGRGLHMHPLIPRRSPWRGFVTPFFLREPRVFRFCRTKVPTLFFHLHSFFDRVFRVFCCRFLPHKVSQAQKRRNEVRIRGKYCFLPMSGNCTSTGRRVRGKITKAKTLFSFIGKQEEGKRKAISRRCQYSNRNAISLEKSLPCCVLCDPIVHSATYPDLD